MERRPKLIVALACLRLAVESLRDGDLEQSGEYRRIADRLIKADRREQEARAERGK